MNFKEFLYSKLAEEAAETGQAAIKCQIFGEESKDPVLTNSVTNSVALENEFTDMIAVIALLNEEHNPQNKDIKPKYDVVDDRLSQKMKKLKVQFELMHQLKEERKEV